MPEPHDHQSSQVKESDVTTRAAQYVRMSTEHQQYSTANQDDVSREYAAKRGFEIVQTYADEGKSGLSVAGRASLKRLIADVTCGAADYSAILVYDVSRWGRFQDADESAYYEYLCKQVGIEVHYCAEQFENDGAPTSTIIKSVKRAMAGEYSCELSSKVFKGQCRLIELGYRQGGAPGYGLRRMLIDQAGEPKTTLAAYAKCLIAATPADQLVAPEGRKKVDELTPEEMARMEREMESLSRDFRGIEETHGKNVLNLVIVAGYVRKLLESAKVVKYLAQECPEILTEFRKIAESRSLAEATVEGPAGVSPCDQDDLP